MSLDKDNVPPPKKPSPTRWRQLTEHFDRFLSLAQSDRWSEVHIISLELATLPPTSQASAIGAKRRPLCKQSIALWHQVADGVPRNVLPFEWQPFAAINSTAELQRIQKLLRPDVTPTSACGIALPNIILNRESSAKTVKRLGRWLFQAAATQEQRLGDDSVVELFLPDWAKPKSIVGFGQELKNIIRCNGGLPQDAGLQEILGQSGDCLASGLWIPEQLSAERFFQMIENLGAMGVTETGVFSGHLLRRKDKAGSFLALERQLQLAQTPHDVAMTLANLAGFHLGQDNFDDAEALLQEALRLNPWSKNARRLVEYLRSAQGLPVHRSSHA